MTPRDLAIGSKAGIQDRVFPRHPLDVLASRPALRLVRTLVLRPGQYTGRQLAREAGVAWARAHTALAALERMGIVTKRPAGRSNLYSLNTASYFVSEVIAPAFRSEAMWTDRLGEEVMELAGRAEESVVLYGSVARGQEDGSSDVDLLVVARDRAGQEVVEGRLEGVRATLSERYGRTVSIHTISRPELLRRIRTGDPFIRKVLRDGRSLAGRSLVEAGAAK